jgi:hypothetical protein
MDYGSRLTAYGPMVYGLRPYGLRPTALWFTVVGPWSSVADLGQLEAERGWLTLVHRSLVVDSGGRTIGRRPWMTFGGARTARSGEGTTEFLLWDFVFCAWFLVKDLTG